MGSFVVRLLLNALALWVTSLVVPGIHLADGSADTGSKIVTVLLVSLVFGVVNALVKPILTFFTFPFVLLTLGLFTIVINAAMLTLTSALAGALGLAFHVDDFFWSAILGAIVLGLVSMLLGAFTPERERVA